MAKDIAVRCLLSGLHIFGGLCLGGSLLGALLQWAQDLKYCFPPLLDLNESVLEPLCDIMKYGNGAMCLVSLLLAVSLNCCWGHWRFLFLHHMLTLLMMLLTACTAAALTMDYILWCQSLIENQRYLTCESAANLDVNRNNASTYFKNMNIQQACEWAAVPFFLVAVVLYSAVMFRGGGHQTENAYEPLEPTHPPRYTQQPVVQGGRYYLVADGRSTSESAPLVVSNAETNLTHPTVAFAAAGDRNLTGGRGGYDQRDDDVVSFVSSRRNGDLSTSTGPTSRRRTGPTRSVHYSDDVTSYPESSNGRPGMMSKSSWLAHHGDVTSQKRMQVPAETQGLANDGFAPTECSATAPDASFNSIPGGTEAAH